MSQNTLSEPETWVEKHGDYLYRFAFLRLRNPELSEEMVQETFLAALRGRDNFKGRSSERTWLVGILKNKLVDHYRKTVREKPLTDHESDRLFEDAFTEKGVWKQMPNAWNLKASDPLDRAEFWQVFIECLSQLPKRLSEAFTLREMDELSSEKICKVLGLTSTNLWVILHRARMRLRACLDSRWFNPKGKR